MHIVLKSSSFSSNFVHTIVKDTLEVVVKKNLGCELLNFPMFEPSSAIEEGALVSVNDTARIVDVSSGGKYEVTDANKASNQYYIRDFYTKKQISTPFQQNELVKFLSGGNIFHAILDQETLWITL